MGIFNHSKNEENEPLVACDNCKQLFPKSKLRKCRKCGAVLCSKCQKTHICQAQTTPKEEPEKIVKNTPIDETVIVVKEPRETIAESPRTIPINNDIATSVLEMQVKSDDTISQNSSKDDLEKVISELSEELKPKLIEKLQGVSVADFDDRLHDTIDNEFDTIISDKISDYLNQQYCDVYGCENEIELCDEWELTENVTELIEARLHDDVFVKVVQNSEISGNQWKESKFDNDKKTSDAFGATQTARDISSAIDELIKKNEVVVLHCDNLDALGKDFSERFHLFLDFESYGSQKIAARDYLGALDVYKKILYLNPFDVTNKLAALYGSAMLYARIGESDNGISLLSDALTLDVFYNELIPLAINCGPRDNGYIDFLDKTRADVFSLKNESLELFKRLNIPVPQQKFIDNKKSELDDHDFRADLDIDKILDICEIYYAPMFLSYAENGDRYAQEIVALWYLIGWNVDKNVAKGLYWLEKSYNSGTGNSCGLLLDIEFVLMGRNYELGITVEKDIKMAIHWYEKGVGANNIASMLYLARLYYDGKEVTQNIDKTISLYTKAAELGNVEAENILGLLYYEDKNVEQDLNKAFYWFTKAAEQENPQALTNLGELYRDGKGVAPDFVRAVELFRKSASYSNVYGMINLGKCYLNGTGVEQDYLNGFSWVMKANESAEKISSVFPEAQYWIGYCYYHGFGVVKSKIKAREWIEKAIKSDDEDALAFAESHPDLNLGGITESLSTTYQISGDLIQGNNSIITKDNAIVNRAHVAKNESQNTRWETIDESTSSVCDSNHMFCPECGKPADEDAKFCKYCGRKLI